VVDTLMQPLVEALGEEFPLEGTTRDKLRAAVKYAILAPSSHNTQPWVFRVREDRLDLFADRSRRLPVVDPDDRELVISCGAALFNLRLALRDFGLAEQTELLPEVANPDLLARIRLTGVREASAHDHALFAAIRRRHTDRSSFESRAVPAPILEALAWAAEREGAWLAVLPTEPAKRAVADLVAQGDRIQMADPQFRRELATWLRPNRSRRRDGMPGFAVGLSDLPALAAPLVIRTFDIGDGRAAQDEALARGSPALAVLGTEHDHPTDWLVAGQALSRVLLQAQAEGVSASFLNQPIEVAALRLPLQAIVARVGYPQMLLRLGYSTRGYLRPTPRRSPKAVTRS
jgi:nitroreductase